MKTKTKRALKAKAYRFIAAFLALNILFEAIAPTCAYALTGGPSQPEVQAFTPVGTSDMVDPFTGDFSYNIPLMDVDGYPINIGYSSGISMDQEASWVGLGWNINPGVINRSTRGLPDDFNGDEMVKELNMKPNRTYGLNVGVKGQLFGLNTIRASYTLGVKYNNYNGYGAEQSLSMTFNSGDAAKGPLTGGLGVNSTSDDGISLSPSIGLSGKLFKTAKSENSLTLGGAFNSRSGLKTLSISVGSDKGLLKLKAINGEVGSAAFDIGMPTYTPSVNMPMQNLSITGNVTFGAEVWGFHPNITLGGYYSGQQLSKNKITNPAYGYMNADEGTKYDNALLDFNREKDGSFTPSTPALPVTNFTYDILSVSGQGVGGSYRPFRSDMGHVFDARSSTTSDGGSIGVELGLGGIAHFGADATVNNVDGTSGRWKNDNDAATVLTHKSTTNNPLYEKYYFKEASEKSVDADPTFFTKAGAYEARAIYLNQLSKFNIIADKYYSTIDASTKKYKRAAEIQSANTRNARERRNQPLTMISRGDLAEFGLEDRAAYLTATGTNAENAKSHHMAEITTLRNDGARYVYGIAAYNTKQEEVTFAVGKTASLEAGRVGNKITGLVNYMTGDNEITNKLGKDNYYSNTKTPAFAHSYLLTAVLSPDYVDSDNTRGPSDGDIGSYTKLHYESRVPNYKWRVPVGERQATFNEGLDSDPTDDKANYIYGEKDLMYLTKIETKNYVAVFTLGNREDGYGVKDKNGKLASASTDPSMKYLKKISLYPKKEYNAAIKNNTTLPPSIKTVNFDYDYSLCPAVNNNSGNAAYNLEGQEINISKQKGKLTLKKIFFTYQNSNKARFSPYEFAYSTINPVYHIKGYDRWGNYKPAPTNINDLTNSDYPYVEQNKTTADNNAEAWSLKQVYLPSGGKIKVDYESDDYAYVQNKQAGQMFKVVGVQENLAVNGTLGNVTLPSNKLIDINFPDGYLNLICPTPLPPPLTGRGTSLIVQLQTPITQGTQAEKNAKFQKDYLAGIDFLYFRFLMEIQKAGANPAKNEFVSGYLRKNEIDLKLSQVDPSGNYASIAIKNTPIGDAGAPCNLNICPITKAAIQFGRLNMSSDVWKDANEPTIDETNGLEEIMNAIAQSGIFENLADMLKGPNKVLYLSPRDIGKKTFLGKSWVRLNNPNKKKLGGGHRVKKIEISDEWDGFGISSSNPSQTTNYGQEYNYDLEDGTSSGVASYEPQLGGDENPWKKPVFFEEKKLLVPDDEHYMEEPFGESFFPSPSIGYSRVTIKNLQRAGVTHNATGKVVHQFYTAKDFPTIAERSDVQARREKNNALSILSLFKLKVRDFMTASQGYVIETNDMHGKPKKQEVYQEGQTTPITSVEYIYKSTPYNGQLGASGTLGSRRLDNTATVVNSNGTVDNNATIGVFFDFVSDMRESTNETTSGSAQFNNEFIPFFIPPVLNIPIILPSFANEKTQFRSAVITKVIQRFGILENTIAKDLGSTVSTKTLAYDAETGDGLLSETITDFNDKVYSLNYPAYWYYNGMGPAYKNIDFTSQTAINFSIIGSGANTRASATVNNALLYFAEGDEISIIDGNNTRLKAWVINVSDNAVQIIDRAGNPIAGTFIKVLRSGRRNQQGVPMATITSLTNPINNIQANVYENVLQAQAMEYTNSWRTYCDCFQGSSTVFSDNPYIIGTKGMYKNKKSYLHLAGRTQSNYNTNTNIRKDGVFTTYSPFYKMNGGKWEMDNKNWTYTSEVTEFSPFGVELENKDALGRYSAATYGYAQSLPTAEAANARYRSIGFDNFEDYDFRTCADNHFKFKVPLKPSAPGGDTEAEIPGSERSLYYNNIDDATAHTGKYSLKVTSGTPINMTKQLTACDPNPCNISATLQGGTSSTVFCYTISGGTAPYQYEWTTPYCDVQFSIEGTGNSICVTKPTATSVCEFVLTVTDKNKCKKIIPLELLRTGSQSNTQLK